MKTVLCPNCNVVCNIEYVYYRCPNCNMLVTDKDGQQLDMNRFMGGKI